MALCNRSLMIMVSQTIKCPRIFERSRTFLILFLMAATSGNAQVLATLKIELDHPIKQLGEHSVPVRLHSEVHATVRVMVVQA